MCVFLCVLQQRVSSYPLLWQNSAGAWFKTNLKSTAPPENLKYWGIKQNWLDSSSFPSLLSFLRSCFLCLPFPSCTFYTPRYPSGILELFLCLLSYSFQICPLPQLQSSHLLVCSPLTSLSSHLFSFAFLLPSPLLHVPPPSLSLSLFLDLLSSPLPSHLFFLLCIRWRINSEQVMPCRATASPCLTRKTTSWDELPPTTYSSAWGSCPWVIYRPECDISKEGKRILSATDELLSLLRGFLLLSFYSFSGPFISVKNQTVPIYACWLVTPEHLSASMFLYDPPPSPSPLAKTSSTDICVGSPLPAVKSFGTHRRRKRLPTRSLFLLFPLLLLHWCCFNKEFS